MYMPGGDRDLYSAQNEQSTVHKLKENYWRTKQKVISNFVKSKEDEHVVASDSELDAKLEVFRHIQKSCMDLLRAIERYQDKICMLSQDENAMGRFLKSQGHQDKTNAGKMMGAVGKSLGFSSQQRLSLRAPLARLYQEVETFRYRAISDTLITINKMESARTEYRAALLWMKNTSEELDPDMYSKMEKFRKVQAQVKKTKTRFDKLKLDVMQKIDLLAASRCNMYSHVLASYQNTLLNFWAKTARTLSAVHESFKGYQYYEFSMLQELTEPCKKLAEQTAAGEKTDSEKQEDIDNQLDRLISQLHSAKYNRDTGQLLMPDGTEAEGPRDITSDEESYASSSRENQFEPESTGLSPAGEQLNGINASRKGADDVDLIETQESTENVSNQKPDESLIDMDSGLELVPVPLKPKNRSNLIDDTNIAGNENTGDLLQPESLIGVEDSSKEQDPLLSKYAENSASKTDSADLLADTLELDDASKDDMALLNEILSQGTGGATGEFSQQWTANFGSMPLPSGSTGSVSDGTDHIPSPGASFMPSHLWDNMENLDGGQGTASAEMEALAGLSLDGTPPSSAQPLLPSTSQEALTPRSETSKPLQQKNTASKAGQPSKKDKNKKDMSPWFNLFADLDPLSNPDAVGRRSDETDESQA